MPIKASAKKSLRVAQHKTSINRYRKTLIKAALKNVTADTAAKAVSMIDKGVKWHLFHQNKAARMKSALTKQLPAGSKITPKTDNQKSTIKSQAPSSKSQTKPKSKSPKTKTVTKKPKVTRA